MSQLNEDLITRLGQAALEAKEQVRELHAAVKDARAAIRDLDHRERDFLAAVKAVSDERAGEIVAKAIEPQMAHFLTSFDEIVNKATVGMQRRLDNTFKVALYGTTKPRPGAKTLLQEIVERTNELLEAQADRLKMALGPTPIDVPDLNGLFTEDPESTT